MAPRPSRQVVFAIVLAALVAAGALVLRADLAAPDGPLRLSLHYALLALCAGTCGLRALRIREQRGAWTAFALGIAAWSLGDVYFQSELAALAEPPFPSPADLGYLLLLPCAYVGIVLLLRGRTQRFATSLWLDGLTAVLAVAAVAAAVLYDAVTGTTGGSLGAVATNLAYPLGDLLLLSLVVAVGAMTAWRPGRAWSLIGFGLAVVAVADFVFLYRTATGTLIEGSLLDVVWPAGFALVAVAAWQPSRRRPDVRIEGVRLMLVPAICATTGLALLVIDHFARLNTPALLLAAATVGVTLVRAGLTFRENLRLFDRASSEAITDALTGLGNRRALTRTLESLLADGAASPPAVLAIYDLDGFKRYNDTFGHPAGDALLGRLGAALAAATVGRASAFRLGGDEFCVLVEGEGTAGLDVLAAADGALCEQGEGFSVTASRGTAVMPAEAHDPGSAMKLADTRMYGAKHASRGSAHEQTRDVLLQVLEERSAVLAEHLLGVASMAAVLAERSGLGDTQRDEVVRAAELHDIGKTAVPDDILRKAGPLDAGEWAYVRRHPEIGERILAAAPSLAPVARLVRSTHERWDGRGYPDGLAGEQIPFGSRLLLVCDAFLAMTRERPYGTARSEAEAVAELRREAGSQFDPVLVELFARVWGEGAFGGAHATIPATT